MKEIAFSFTYLGCSYWMQCSWKTQIFPQWDQTLQFIEVLVSKSAKQWHWGCSVTFVGPLHFKQYQRGKLFHITSHFSRLVLSTFDQTKPFWDDFTYSICFFSCLLFSSASRCSVTIWSWLLKMKSICVKIKLSVALHFIYSFWQWNHANREKKNNSQKLFNTFRRVLKKPNFFETFISMKKIHRTLQETNKKAAHWDTKGRGNSTLSKIWPDRSQLWGGFFFGPR